MGCVATPLKPLSMGLRKSFTTTNHTFLCNHGVNVAERLHWIARHPLSVLSRQSNFLSAKQCGYLLALIFLCLFGVMPAIAGVDKVVYWAPWVTKTSINSATINWHGAINAAGEKAGEIEYATTSYYNAHDYKGEKYEKVWR